MTILDRMFFINYVRSYLIVFSSLLSLYVIIDLFTNLNDFVKGKDHFHQVVVHILGYYSVQVTLIFDRLCEAITLIAAVFAVAWMQKNNELLPQLSAGISTHRVLRPILLGSALTLLLIPANREILIPSISERLNVPRDDPEMRKPIQVRSGFDPATKEHIAGEAAHRDEKKITGFEYTSSGEGFSGLIHVQARMAQYVPPGQPNQEGYSGGWMLYQAMPQELGMPPPENLVPIMPGQYFLKTKELDFEYVTRRPNWFEYGSTRQLWDMLQRTDNIRQSTPAVLLHMRLTRPLLGFILVVLGLSVILRDQYRHVFISAGMCLVMSTWFYMTIEVCKYLGKEEVLPPALSAWIPVMIFGPIAISQFDAIHT